jgi:type IV pilus assembly protein PilY1
MIVTAAAQAAPADLSDQPVYSTLNVPGNLAITASVEFPTALGNANGSSNTNNIGVSIGTTNYGVSAFYGNDFSPSNTYQGLFDPYKCYGYAVNGNGSYFYPASNTADPTTVPACSGSWSGNYLNWATAGTIDVFRQVLTGGYRYLDSSTGTILEKAYSSTQAPSGYANFPLKVTSGSSAINVSSLVNATAAITNFNSRVWGIGNQMWFTVPTIQDNGVSLASLTPLPIASGGTSLPASTVPIAYDGHQLTASDIGKVYSATVRVQVCQNSANLESNCTSYPSNLTYDYKPEGLIQKYANKIRFAIFGYLNDTAYEYPPSGILTDPAQTNLLLDGAVLRARMAFVGPTQPVPGSTPITNPNAEWDPNTGVFVTNPDPTDASDTTSATGATVANSGVSNYLNKFGEFGQSYKTFDNVSELYYAALRYFKNLGNVPEWIGILSASAINGNVAPTAAQVNAFVDGFPVIGANTSKPWGDPIQYACQANFILGIGDTSTHSDSNVPGSMTPARGNTEPAKPSLVSADTSVDALTATNKVGALELASGDPYVTSTTYASQIANSATSPLGTIQIPWSAYDDARFAIAGLAYDAHTVDQRPNSFNTSASGNLSSSGTKIFTQTISTYWLDVVYQQTFNPYNQFWLAAKYGGFKVPSGYQPYATNAVPPVKSSWNTTTRVLYADGGNALNGSTPSGGFPLPDNYYNGSDPVSLKNGLTSAFASIASTSNLSAISSAFSVGSLQVASLGGISYSSNYQAGSWVGNVSASTSTFDSSGNLLSQTTIWSEQGLLDTQAASVTTGSTTVNGWDTGRIIATSSGAASTSPSPTGIPFRLANLSATEKAQLNSSSSTSLTSTDQQTVLNFLRGDRSNEGTLFRTRSHLLGDIVDSAVVVVGAPSAPYSDSNDPGYSSFISANSSRPTVVYVGANDGFLHAFDGSITDSTQGKELFAYMPSFVISGPTGTSGIAGNGAASLANTNFAHYFMVDATPLVTDIDFGYAGTSTAGTPNWHSVLIGGLGKGGKGYYALDVTSPQSISSETVLASKVLWEFTDTDMGYSYGPPIVVKTKQYGWVAILTSGYNNTGLGYLYIVNPQTGKLLQKIATTAGTSTTPSGLTYASAFVNDYSNYTADSVYAGDLLGNLWRFDLTAATGSYPPPTQFASLTDANGNAQPVTTSPVIEVDPTSQKRYVAVGTGRLLGTSDISDPNSSSPSLQDFYVFRDGTSTSFSNSGSYPITRSSLINDTSTLLSANSAITSALGFYIDLSPTVAPEARVIIPAAANQGIVAFASSTPNGSVCNPGGASTVYAFSLSTGLTVLTSATGQLVASVALTSSATSIGFYNVNGNVRLEVGTSVSSGSGAPLNNINATLNTALSQTRLNWREIPLTN